MASARVPFRLYTDPEQYRIEQERIFKGPTWNYLCLAAEIPEPGDWVATTIGEVAIVVVRGPTARSTRLSTAAPSRQPPVPDPEGPRQGITCIYHGWSYDLEGKLTGVASSAASSARAACRPNSARTTINLQRLQVAELSGLIFGSFDEDVPDLETYLGRSWPVGSAA